MSVLHDSFRRRKQKMQIGPSVQRIWNRTKVEFVARAVLQIDTCPVSLADPVTSLHPLLLTPHERFSLGLANGWLGLLRFEPSLLDSDTSALQSSIKTETYLTPQYSSPRLSLCSLGDVFCDLFTEKKPLVTQEGMKTVRYPILEGWHDADTFCSMVRQITLSLSHETYLELLHAFGTVSVLPLHPTPKTCPVVSIKESWQSSGWSREVCAPVDPSTSSQR